MLYQQGSCFLLIAPRWPTRVWFSDLISFLEALWVIPIGRDVLSQAQETSFHPCVKYILNYVEGKFIHSFIQSFIRSFVHLFIHSFIPYGLT